MESTLSASANRPLDRQVAVITGGSAGIGRATCLALAEAGARIVILARTPDRVRATAMEIEHLGNTSGPPIGIPVDVRDDEQVRCAVDHTIRVCGRVDILVACAGIGRGPGPGTVVPRMVAELSTQEWRAVLDTNLKGVFVCDRAVLPHMIRQRRGEIVHVSSARGGRRGEAYAAAYSASKSGLIGLSEALAGEVGPWGVRVQVVLPDVTDTELLRSTTLSAKARPLLPAGRVAEFILRLVTSARDITMLRPVLAPTADNSRA